ncbi:MAG: sugar phosphate isomerase/epimerase [Firmicutes bacterium]|nr:sugar phosphate isomerase/epimerase [Bacillota bacterium]
MNEDLKLAYMVATPDVRLESALGYSGSLESAAMILKELGYDGMELTVANPSLLDWGLIANIAAGVGLDIPMICTGEVFAQEGLGLADPDADVRAAALERVKHVIRLASYLGAMVNIGRSRGRYEELIPREQTENWAYDAFLELANYAQERDVTIALEPIASHVCNFINSTQDGLEWVTRVNHPNFRLMVDIYHMNIEDRTPMDESLRAAGDALVYVHLCDSNRKPPGWGHIDFAQFISDLRAAGYKGWVSAEVFNYPDQIAAVDQSAWILRPIV